MSSIVDCCTFQLAIFCCAHPGERLLLRKGPCAGTTACKPSLQNTIASTIRKRCSHCKVEFFFRTLLGRKVEEHQAEFEAGERDARSARCVKCNKCGEEIDISAIEGHMCVDLACGRCGGSFESRREKDRHTCVDSADVWAIGSDTHRGCLVAHKKPSVIGIGQSQDKTSAEVRRDSGIFSMLKSFSSSTLCVTNKSRRHEESGSDDDYDDADTDSVSTMGIRSPGMPVHLSSASSVGDASGQDWDTDTDSDTESVATMGLRSSSKAISRFRASKCRSAAERHSTAESDAVSLYTMGIRSPPMAKKSSSRSRQKVESKKSWFSWGRGSDRVVSREVLYDVQEGKAPF